VRRAQAVYGVGTRLRGHASDGIGGIAIDDEQASGRQYQEWPVCSAFTRCRAGLAEITRVLEWTQTQQIIAECRPYRGTFPKMFALGSRCPLAPATTRAQAVNPATASKGHSNMRRLLNQAANASRTNGSISSSCIARVPRVEQSAIGAMPIEQCRLMGDLHQGVRYEERGPGGHQRSTQLTQWRMIRPTPNPRLSHRTTEPEPSRRPSP